MHITERDVFIPTTIPSAAKGTYTRNMLDLTRETGNLMLFAGDQKVEHLNNDFYGPNIHEDDGDPEHLFRIADKAEIGVFASQLGLISLYGHDYSDIQYVVKLNSRTNLLRAIGEEPYSRQWIDVSQVIEFKKTSGLKILGVGYSVYLGSKYEANMLHEAAQVVYQAHQYGLVVILWIFPRGKAIRDNRDPHLIAGACGVGAALGSDFVKVNYPEKRGFRSEEIFKEAIRAAGRCKVICAGGSSIHPKPFLRRLYDQIFISGARGNATGRNIHQKSLDKAVRMCNAISAITLKGKSVEEALKIYEG
jgi:fructose-bisphosphate aldolase/6-deoxy-5-ketofructose 1-phosphate synthase